MDHWLRHLLLLSLTSLSAVLLAACGNPGPAQHADPPESASRSIDHQVDRAVVTPTPVDPVRIYELVLSTGVDSDGEPQNDLLSLPANAPVAYLMVLVSDAREGSEFEAEWLREGETIGWSQHRIRDADPSTTWIALQLEPDGGFTAGEYSVRLTIDGRRIESLVFRAGAGRAAQPVASPRLVFATSWSVEQEAINAQSTFEFGTQRVIAILTDTPGGGQLTSQWFHGGDHLADVPGDAVESQSARTFTFDPNGPLLPGQYRVSVFSGSQHVLTASFMISPPSDVATDAEILDLVITWDFDPETGGPAGDPIERAMTPTELVALALVQNLSPNDMLEIIWLRNDEVVSHQRIVGESISRSWVRTRYVLPAEDGDDDSHYRVVVNLNGNAVIERRFIAQRPD